MSENGITYIGSDKFVHLHCHTVYSTLDGVQTPEQLVGECAKRQWPAVAVTEHGHMSSVPDNHFAAVANNIKYIAGCEIYYNDFEPLRRQMMADGTKITSLKENNRQLYDAIMRNRHLTILCKNKIGFHNLIKMTTEAWEDGFYYRPRIWFDKIDKYREGLIVLSGCLNGAVSRGLLMKDYMNPDHRGAIDYVNRFRELFGDDFYLEMQMPCLPDIEDYRVFWALNKMADKMKIGRALTNDVHYIDRRDFDIQKMMMAIDQGMTVNDPELFHVNSSEQYLKTRAELFDTFKRGEYCEHVDDSKFEIMCDTTLEIASKCDKFQPDTQPKIPTNEGDTRLLKELVMRAMIERGLHKCEKKYVVDNRQVTYFEQAKIELGRFIEKGFSSYFIITRDLIQYGIQNGHPFGPRGSVGGSLVCYLLGITELDPLKWGLSFDRFLSPSRGGEMLNIKAE